MTTGQTPQPSGSQSRYQRGTRRVVESETSSNISSVIEEEDEDEDEDEGPIRRGQRNRAQARILNRANGSREPSGPPSSTSTDVSTDDLDEDTQALLQSQGWMLQHHGADEMGEDDDSDGGRTTVGSTVGWDATAISNDRVRMGGSLTPTADRPRPNRPNNTIRPPSRVGNPLRRQTPVLSTANGHYEDGEADDDDSDMDQDGDVTMAINSLRNRRSRIQLRNNAAAFTNFNNRHANRTVTQDNPADADADDNSDHSQDGRRRTRQQAYNPRISRLFADHQRALQEIQGGLLVDLEPRSITPIARPRTSNRNRPSPAQAFSPFLPPAPVRMRTPLMNNTANPAFNPRAPASPPRRTPVQQNLAEVIRDDPATNTSRASSISSASNSSAVLTPGASTPTSQQSSSTVSHPQAGLTIDLGDRPPSRVNSRPPSAAGRRNSAAFSPVYSQFPHSNVGLNIQGRIFPPPQAGNPWGAFVQPRIRNRNSRQVLREQSSTATLRAVNSRANIREPVGSPQGVRAQAPRMDLRPQQSRRRLNTQASVRTLRASEHGRPPSSPTTAGTNGAPSPSRPPRYTPEETDRLARELINTRMQVLRPPGPTPARNNPFVPGFRRPVNSSDASAGATSSYHSRSNSNESVNSGNSSHTATIGSSSPGLTRRRSNRHMGAAPPGVLPPATQGGFPPASYAGNYTRARQNSIGNSFDMPLDASARGMSPMMATSLI